MRKPGVAMPCLLVRNACQGMPGLQQNSCVPQQQLYHSWHAGLVFPHTLAGQCWLAMTFASMPLQGPERLRFCTDALPLETHRKW
jgi:hypothetical protein